MLDGLRCRIVKRLEDAHSGREEEGEGMKTNAAESNLKTSIKTSLTFRFPSSLSAFSAGVSSSSSLVSSSSSPSESAACNFESPTTACIRTVDSLSCTRRRRESLSAR